MATSSAPYDASSTPVITTNTYDNIGPLITATASDGTTNVPVTYAYSSLNGLLSVTTTSATMTSIRKTDATG